MTDKEERLLLAKLWFLVEWDIEEAPSTYSVVNWSALVGPPPRSKLCTGKTVLVRRGKRANPANIVIMSDDKRFLDTELQQLRTIAAANLQNKIEISRKRRKTCMTTESPPESVSSNSEMPSCSTSPLPSNHTQILSHKFKKITPPMTFDQQTQTESKIFNNGGLSDNVVVDHRMLEEMRLDQKNIREDLLELMRQMENMQSALTEVIGTRTKHEDRRNMSLSPLPSTSTPFNGKNNPDTVICKSLTSKPSTKDSSIIDSDPEYEPPSSEMNFMPLSSSQRMNMTFNGFSNNVFSNMQKPWEEQRYPDDMVPIGSGKTLIPVHIMNQINWSSHSNATRRLLMSVFNRHTLATHSLTGKASPAFNGINTKPQKMRLNPEKIMDIIQTVSKYCGVKESAVRSAITTKCADENKMLRVRMEKEHKENDENKENGEINFRNDDFKSKV